MTDAELRDLLADCVTLWDVRAKVSADVDGIAVTTALDDRYVVSRGTPPARWLLRTPQRDAAGRGPRAAPSIVALLSALRVAMGAAGGPRLRVG